MRGTPIESKTMDNTDKAEQVLPQWELKKENVAPARKGVRSISSLDEQLKAREGLRGLTVNEDLKLKEERKCVELFFYD